MSNVETVARTVQAAISSEAGYLLIAQWISDRYAQVAAKARFRHLRRIGAFTAPAVINTGTVSITTGTRTVTGNTAAIATWSPDIVGRHFRAANAWYEIASFNGDDTITLKTAYSEDTVSAGTYTIAARYIILDPIARWISDTMIVGRTGRIVMRTTTEQMDTSFGRRLLESSNWPNAWSEIGSRANSDGKFGKLIEFYPALTDTEIIYYTYWEIPATLALKDELPPGVDAYALKEGALVDAMRRKSAIAADANQVEIAAYWRNEYRAQETRWARIMLEIIASDRGQDDATFILSGIGRASFSGDITDARSEIFARGDRP